MRRLDEDGVWRSGLRVLLQPHHDLAPGVCDAAGFGVVAEAGVTEVTVAPPAGSSTSQCIGGPTQWGGKVSVRQTTDRSSDCSSRRSKGRGASCELDLQVSPTSAGTSARLVQNPLIPSVALDRSRAPCRGLRRRRSETVCLPSCLPSF